MHHSGEYVLSLNPSFAARTFSGDIRHITPHEWYQQRLKDITELKNYNPHDIGQAQKIAKDLEKRIAVGILYKSMNPQLLDAFRQTKMHKICNNRGTDFL